jgi:hypothetical protein
MSTPTNIKVRIETRKTDPYECEAVDVKAAIDAYIENRLGEDGFALSDTVWDVVKAAVTDTSHLVELVNGLCKSSFSKITRIISGYEVDYPVEVVEATAE